MKKDSFLPATIIITYCFRRQELAYLHERADKSRLAFNLPAECPDDLLLCLWTVKSARVPMLTDCVATAASEATVRCLEIDQIGEGVWSLAIDTLQEDSQILELPAYHRFLDGAVRAPVAKRHNKSDCCLEMAVLVHMLGAEAQPLPR